MFSFQIINHPESFSLDHVRIADIFQCVAEMGDIPQKGILNIAFLSDSEIQALNSQYRKKDTTTDVLSFHYFEDFSDISEDDIAGEIILSESQIILQSTEENHSLEKECEVLVIHSILHIIGYDHETDEDYQAMWKVEKPIREKFGLHV